MNWATIAPEFRLYKGKNLFRWEDSPGLEHHCGTCATPLHNARAKSSCLLKHVEPCYRFHQQLHFIGKSHECFGCNASDELHHTRHKEILKIIRQITSLDQGNFLTPFKPSDTEAKERRSSSAPSTATPTDTSSETFGPDGNKLTRRERKKAKKAGNRPTKERKTPDSFSRGEIDFISEAIHLKVMESKGAWEGTYVYYTKVEGEEVEHVGDDEDAVQHVAQKVDALSVKQPNGMTPRQRKVVKKTSTSAGHSNFRGGSRKFSPQTTSKTDPYDGLDPKIFFRLGIEVENPLKNSKARRDLAVKLVAAVKEDLEIIEREDKECALREEGFWRWAGKPVYFAIQRHREGLDWATGQKIAPRREGVAENAAGCEEDIEEIENDKGEPPTRNTRRRGLSWKETSLSFEEHLANTRKRAGIEETPATAAEADGFEDPLATPLPVRRTTEKPVAPKQKVDENAVKSPSVAEGDDQGRRWEVVKPYKKSGKRPPINQEPPRSIFRKKGEPLTISVK